MTQQKTSTTTTPEQALRLLEAAYAYFTPLPLKEPEAGETPEYYEYHQAA